MTFTVSKWLKHEIFVWLAILSRFLITGQRI